MTTLEPFCMPKCRDLDVPDIYYRRHLGLPHGAKLEQHLVDLTDQARRWYQENSTPWTTARHVAIDKISGDVIHLQNGVKLTSPVFARGLSQADAHGVVIVGVTAGATVDRKIADLWAADRPDEAMFLNSYAIAAVEHLRWTRGEHLSQTFRKQAMTVLPHYSPGYEGWELGDQRTLFDLIREPKSETDFPLDILESGCLLPMKSTLAAYGITHRNDLGKLDHYWTYHLPGAKAGQTNATTYAFPQKALTRWQEKRLSITAVGRGKIQATFRIDGSTCTNMGTPLAFVYRVCLEHEGNAGYRITSVSCAPAEEELGYQSMCAYLDNPERFMEGIANHQPLAGQLLHDAVTWEAATSPAGCLCTRPSQDHKWRIVLQTIHYALEGKNDD